MSEGTQSPRFKAGNARLRALFDHVYKLRGSMPIQMETVAEWAIENGLYPVPVRGCSQAEAIAWERRFDAAIEESEKRDWRVGLLVKPKYRTHELHGVRGTISAVHPDGHAGIHDADGVFEIDMDGGRHVVEPADNWVTA